jgi:hypothetical protein
MAINFAINLAINSVIAWFAFSTKARVAMWGEHSFGGDLAITAFILCWIVGAIFVAIHRSKVNNDKLPAVELDLPAWLPKNPILIGLLLATIALLVYYPLTLLALLIFGFSEMDLLVFSVFKGLWAGLLACLVIPPAMIFGLATATKIEPISV